MLSSIQHCDVGFLHAACVSVRLAQHRDVGSIPVGIHPVLDIKVLIQSHMQVSDVIVLCIGDGGIIE